MLTAPVTSGMFGIASREPISEQLAEAVPAAEAPNEPKARFKWIHLQTITVRRGAVGRASRCPRGQRLVGIARPLI